MASGRAGLRPRSGGLGRADVPSADKGNGMSRLVLVIGVAGSGKTTLSKMLAPKIPSLYLCSDTITDVLCASDRVSPDYVQLRPRIYATMYAIAEENLRLGRSVLIDAPHLPTIIGGEWPDRMHALAGRAGSQLKVIRLVCPERELRDRLERRGSERDADKLMHWDEHLAECPIFYDVPLGHANLNTERRIEGQLTTALAYIRAP